MKYDKHSQYLSDANCHNKSVDGIDDWVELIILSAFDCIDRAFIWIINWSAHWTYIVVFSVCKKQNTV